MARTSRSLGFAVALVAAMVSGCGILQPVTREVVTVDSSPISPELIGPLIERPGAPPIECRGVPRVHCLDGGEVELEAMGFAPGDIERLIVTCTVAQCTPADGEYRVDVLRKDGRSLEVMGGAYSTTN